MGQLGQHSDAGVGSHWRHVASAACVGSFSGGPKGAQQQVGTEGSWHPCMIAEQVWHAAMGYATKTPAALQGGSGRGG